MEFDVILFIRDVPFEYYIKTCAYVFRKWLIIHYVFVSMGLCDCYYMLLCNYSLNIRLRWLGVNLSLFFVS